jgi:hypothetical protein
LLANSLAPAGGGMETIKKLISGRGIAGLAALIPALSAMFKNGGGSDGPFGKDGNGLTEEIRQGLSGQRERFEATKPAFDTAQRMAIGMAPTRYRSGPFGG